MQIDIVLAMLLHMCRPVVDCISEQRRDGTNTGFVAGLKREIDSRNNVARCRLVVLPFLSEQHRETRHGDKRMRLAQRPHAALEVFLDRQVRETARLQLRIDDQQIAACVQDEVDVDVDGHDLVAFEVILRGGDKLIRFQRLGRAHDSFYGALCHHGRASGLGAYDGVQLVVGLFQVARQPAEPRADIALALQLEKLVKLQGSPLEHVIKAESAVNT